MTETTANEKIDKIARKCLELLEEKLNRLEPSMQYDAATEVRSTGDALKALAEGIESCKMAMRSQKDSTFTVPKQ